MRNGAITRSLSGEGRGLAQVAVDDLDEIADVVAAGAPLGLGQHRRRRVERDHAMAVAGELDRDAPAARSQLDDRPLGALAGQDVERDVVVDAVAPAVVERPEPLVGLAAGCCRSASHRG